MYLESNGFRLDAGGLQARAVSGVIGLLLLRTRTGRRLAFAGWLFILALTVLSFASIEHAPESFELLLWWLLIGALWFVDYGRLAKRVTGPRPTVKTSRSARKPLIRETRSGYALEPSGSAPHTNAA
jgi:hypothetical protein